LREVAVEWLDTRILVIGKNYPALSRLHAEVSCTGGLLEDGLELIRLHPISYRMLEDDQRFRNFQWIRARIARRTDDPRPESHRVDPGSIEVMEHVSPERADVRRSLIDGCPSHFASVEALQARQALDRTSLGIVRPRRITGADIRIWTDVEVQEWVEKEAALRSQGVLFEDVRPGPLSPPGADFLVSWECDDATCRGHGMALHQWGIHQLWRKLRDDPARVDKTKARMRERLDMNRHDLYLFLGNYGYRPAQFGLMEVVALDRQTGRDDGPSLFD
jgi:hypothetical protein